MKKITAALGVAALALSLGVAAAPTASAQSSSSCSYTNSEPTLSRGSTGTAVKQLQCELHYSMTGSNLTRDGIFGGGTLNDVRRFQQCAGLDVDGIVGPNTWAALDYWTTASDYAC
ncbi:peptidoglycan-binding protein [Kitasatospora aureofaciens]|uniref:peptidoglycan-binding domain-containing protein n=1 Tax=Kitasatospora aureofaciens TaxID=1894 RepID=UPI001C466673|nr:peptidoglycan-binding domain-containing protein [Kitasatospora aureofaciens]MBV6700325.1 peptidoglycan-binding protein [Kitasatospora aureofaciens]